jgi:hypothetical protein
LVYTAKGSLLQYIRRVVAGIMPSGLRRSHCVWRLTGLSVWL